MPTYEYECRSCEYTFEEFQSITAAPRETCPKCGGKVHRLIGKGSAVIFKGSGFYATDYRSDEYKKRVKEEKGETKKEKGDTKKEKGKKEDSSSSPGKDTGNKK